MLYTMIYKWDGKVKTKTVSADDMTDKIKLLETLADEGCELISIVPAISND